MHPDENSLVFIKLIGITAFFRLFDLELGVFSGCDYGFIALPYFRYYPFNEFREKDDSEESLG